MEKRLSALVFGAAMMGVLAGCDHFASAKEGEPVSGKVISSAIQPAARLDVKNGTYVWSVADIIDLGGESTRPGATPLKWQEEWSRLEPVLAGLKDARLETGDVCLSVDTYHPETAEKALAALQGGG